MSNTTLSQSRIKQYTLGLEAVESKIESISCSKSQKEATMLLCDLKETMDMSFSSIAAPNVRSSIKKIYRTLDGLLNGLEENKVSRSFVKKTLKSTGKNIESIANYIKAAEDRYEVEQAKSDPITVALKSALSSGKVTEKDQNWISVVKDHKTNKDTEKNISEMIKKQREEIADAEVRAKLAQYKKEITAVMPRKVSLFTILTVPILPIFEDFNMSSTKVMTKLAVPHSMINGTAILEKQLVLAFSKKGIAHVLGQTKLLKVPVTRKAQTLRDSVLRQFVEKALELINERSITSYSVVSEKLTQHPANKDVLFCWIAPTTQILKLQQIAKTSKGMKMRDWGFPTDIK